MSGETAPMKIGRGFVRNLNACFRCRLCQSL
jgi:hypothetical protein